MFKRKSKKVYCEFCKADKSKSDNFNSSLRVLEGEISSLTSQFPEFTPTPTAVKDGEWVCETCVARHVRAEYLDWEYKQIEKNQKDALHSTLENLKIERSSSKLRLTRAKISSLRSILEDDGIEEFLTECYGRYLSGVRCNEKLPFDFALEKEICQLEKEIAQFASDARPEIKAAIHYNHLKLQGVDASPEELVALSKKIDSVIIFRPTIARHGHRFAEIWPEIENGLIFCNFKQLVPFSTFVNQANVKDYGKFSGPATEQLLEDFTKIFSQDSGIFAQDMIDAVEKI